eukprot:860637-Rhodomonas_salina.1
MSGARQATSIICVQVWFDHALSQYHTPGVTQTHVMPIQEKVPDTALRPLCQYRTAMSVPDSA